MLHVVHVLHSLGVGGTENGVVNLIGSLGREVRHTVISMVRIGPLAERLPAGVPVRCVGKRAGVDLRAAVKLARLLRALRPHIVHSRNWGAVDAVLAARLARVPVLIHGEHGREAADPYGLDARRNRIRRLLSPLVSRWVTVSHDLGRWLVEVVGIPARKVLTIHNGVDVARFSEAGREAGRRTLGLGPEALVVGTVGRLNSVKNQMALLDTFARLDPAPVAAHLVIVGEGPARADLEGRTRRRDLAGRVRLLGARDDVPALLAAFDVFVLPSIAEGISNTILEAMATGVPVIATRVGGNPELVEDGVTGMLAPADDPAALGRALAVYLADPHLRSLHGKTGRQRAVEEFALERMTTRYRDLYLSLAPGRTV